MQYHSLLKRNELPSWGKNHDETLNTCWKRKIYRVSKERSGVAGREKEDIINKAQDFGTVKYFV